MGIQMRRTKYYLPKTYIYGLIDPRTNEIRYIGKAVNLDKRMYRHLYRSRRGDKTHKACWIRNLHKHHLNPILIELEQVSDWKEAEVWWIAYFKFLGANLTNQTPGGEGYRIIHTEETKRKISENQMGERNHNYGKPKSEEVRRKMSESHKKLVITEETRRKMSEAKSSRVYVCSEETRRKLSEAGKGRVFSKDVIEKIAQKNRGKKRSPEVRQKISQARKDNPITPEVREKMNQYWEQRRIAKLQGGDVSDRSQ